MMVFKHSFYPWLINPVLRVEFNVYHASSMLFGSSLMSQNIFDQFLCSNLLYFKALASLIFHCQNVRKYNFLGIVILPIIVFRNLYKVIPFLKIQTILNIAEHVFFHQSEVDFGPLATTKSEPNHHTLPHIWHHRPTPDHWLPACTPAPQIHPPIPEPNSKNLENFRISQWQH